MDAKTSPLDLYLSPLARSIAPYVAGEQPKDRRYIKLNTNESPYSPSPRVAEAMAESPDLRLYPDINATRILEAVSRRTGLPADHVFAGNGSDEVLALAFQAFFSPDLGVLAPEHTYSFYPVYASLYGIPYHTAPLNADLSISLPTLMGDLPVAVANPNAPTSVALPLRDIRALATHLRAQRCLLLVDEAYAAFGAESADGLVSEFENLLVVHTLSKSHALAGLRVGYALGQPHLIAGLRKMRDSFNSYPLDHKAIWGGAAAIDDDEYCREIVGKVMRTRAWFSEELRAMGFEVPDSRTNFVFPRHPKCGARGLFEALRARGILVRYFNKPGISDRLRITMGTDEDMRTVTDALRALVAERT